MPSSTLLFCTSGASNKVRAMYSLSSQEPTFSADPTRNGASRKTICFFSAIHSSPREIVPEDSSLSVYSRSDMDENESMEAIDIKSGILLGCGFNGSEWVRV